MNFSLFEHVLLDDLIPYIDANFRTLSDQPHRAMAGLEKKVVLLGMGSKFELWSEQAHAAQVQSTIGEDEVSDAMLELRL